MDFKQKIREILIKILSLDTIPDTLAQENCEYWDSLRHLFIMIELESAFGISFYPAEIEKMKTVQEIERIVGNKTEINH
jgi:acyl carrier protein